MQSHVLSWLVAGLVPLAYTAVLLWFEYVDFYNEHFFDEGMLVAAYQIARLVFTACILWMLYAFGAIVVELGFQREWLDGLLWTEIFALCFVVGGGLAHLIAFGLGLSGLLLKPIAATLTITLMAMSTPRLAGCLRPFVESLMHNKGARTFGKLSFLRVALGTASIILASVFVITKGLYPAGGHDYFLHYFPYYRTVVEQGSILPNEVWYHFFYSKGAGLFFLAILLTDPLAPQLVTTTFVIAGSMIVFATVSRATRGDRPLLPWVGITLYFAFLIYTPGPNTNMREGGWGDMEKIHELTALAIFALIWIGYRLTSCQLVWPGPWVLGLYCAIVMLAILTPALVVLAGGWLAAIWATVLLRQRKREAWYFFGAGVVCVTSVLLILLVNYELTGLILDQLIVPLWRFTDLEKIENWGVMLEVLLLHNFFTGIAQTPVPILRDIFPALATFLRLELWWPIFVSAAAVIMLRLGSAQTRTGMQSKFQMEFWLTFGAFALVVIGFAFVSGGRTLTISFYRLTTLSYGPVLCMALVLWHIALAGSVGKQQFVFASFGGLVICASLLVIISSIGRDQLRLLSGNLFTIVTNSSELLAGKLSLRDAYEHQEGWPGRLPWGAIYPGIVTPWMIADENQRIWSFHIHSYCMLPHCNVQGIFSMRFSPRSLKLISADPSEARSMLKNEGLEYFFFSSELPFDDYVLPRTRLFSPDNIAEWLAVRWTDGTSYLLTWSDEPGTRPIDDKFLQAYRGSVAKSITWYFDMPAWKTVSDYVEGHKGHLRPFAPPWCFNCEGLEPVR
jgi:hypothetical protein